MMPPSSPPATAPGAASPFTGVRPVLHTPFGSQGEVLYDELAVGLGSLDVTLALANRLTSTMRSDTALGGPMPAAHPLGSATAS